MAYSVAFDASSLIKGLHAQLKAAIAQAVQTTAIATYTAWYETVLRSPGVPSFYKDRYAASINVEFDSDRMGARIYSDDPISSLVENGFPARDQKLALNTSAKVRVAHGGKHAGQRFLIIPFRINTPKNTALAGDMPQAVYAQAKQMAKSTVTGKVSMRSGLGASSLRTKGPLMTMRNTYAWGDRLDGADIPKRFKGMVRFDTSSGGQKSSSHITFRVMGAWSSGWVIPSKPGTFIVRAISEQARQMLQTEVTSAIASVS